MKKHNTSLVVTVLNEEEHIREFIFSIFNQSQLPDEVVIVDGGSFDQTVANIKYQISNIKYGKKFRILKKKGNRSVGRNYGIKKSKNEIILITDAGCILDKRWVKNICEPFKKSSVDVVAGYYSAKPQNIFEKCLVPYVLIMPDKVNPKTFLPATRSMALRKKVWEHTGGFNENYSHNEDYVFAKKIKKAGYTINFQKNAISYWIPRKNFFQAFIMFFRFALGDAQALLIRPKVLLIFLRYMVGVFLLVYYLYTQQFLALSTLLLLVILYYIWAILKNYKYVNDVRALVILPLLQITSDVAVIAGTLSAVEKRLF